MAKEKRGYVVFSLLGTALLFFILTGHDLYSSGNINWTAAYTLKTLGISLIAGILSGILSVQLLERLQKRNRPVVKSRRNVALAKCVSEEQPGISSLWQKLLSFPVSWALIFLCWLPCFLAYYPAICAYDTPVQLGQCESGMWNDHHPYMHTWLINLFWQLGKKVFGSVNTGMALYALFQMLALSGAFAAGIYLLKKRKSEKTGLYLLLAFACLYPFHMFMGISVTKDSLFAASLLVTVALLYCVLLDGRNEIRWNKTDAALCLALLPALWFRNNARYAVLLFLALLLLMSLFGKKERKLWFRLLTVMAGGFFAGMLTLTVSYHAAGVQQGDRREMLSMPIQQLARTMYYHEEEMDEETRLFLGNVMLNESWRSYDPAISDPVKRNVYTGYIKNNFTGFLKTYLQLFLKYPGDYINAALALDAGYLYPFDISSAEVNLREEETGLGYVQTKWSEEVYGYGLTPKPVLTGCQTFLEKLFGSNAYLKWPVINFLLMPGWLFWVYLYAAAILWYKRKYRLLAPFVLAGAYFATLLLGPAVQLRYLYPLTVCLPFVLAAVWKEERSTDI